MYSLHFAGALLRAEDPREVRNRDHLRVLREAVAGHRSPIEPVRRSARVERLAFAGGSLTRSTDFGPVCCPA